MRRVILVETVPSYLNSIAGRLRGIQEVSALQETGPDGEGLALLMDVEDEAQLIQLMENRIGLITGINGWRVAQGPVDETMTAGFAPA